MKHFLDDPMIQRQIIMEHYKKPKNRSLLDNPDEENYKHVHMDSESCVDDIHIQVKIEDGIIKDVRFDGEACAISTASTSIMTDMLKGKTLDEAKYLIEQYNNMVYNREYDKEALGEALAFSNIHKQANRIKCATIGWDGVESIVSKEG